MLLISFTCAVGGWLIGCLVHHLPVLGVADVAPARQLAPAAPRLGLHLDLWGGRISVQDNMKKDAQRITRPLI